MSMPAFPQVSNSLTREAAINQLLSSIAMEELALSHILNAEGEKIQHVLGTLTGQNVSNAPIADLLAIDESVVTMLESVRETQAQLMTKMAAALAASDAAPAGGV